MRFRPYLILPLLAASLMSWQLRGSQSLPDLSAAPFKAPAELDAYAQAFSDCLRPGPNMDVFTRTLVGSPGQRLLKAYAVLNDRWQYRPDGPAEMLQSAEASLGPLKMSGDCEDFAAAILCVAVHDCGLRGRLVVCYGLDQQLAGHAYCEVLISKNLATAVPVLNEVARELHLTAVACRADQHGVWLPLDLAVPDQVRVPQVYCLIYPDGTVEVPEHAHRPAKPPS